MSLHLVAWIVVESQPILNVYIGIIASSGGHQYRPFCSYCPDGVKSKGKFVTRGLDTGKNSFNFLQAINTMNMATCVERKASMLQCMMRRNQEIVGTMVCTMTMSSLRSMHRESEDGPINRKKVVARRNEGRRRMANKSIFEQEVPIDGFGLWLSLLAGHSKDPLESLLPLTLNSTSLDIPHAI